MLIKSLMPLLEHYSLGIDLVAAPGGGGVTLTIMPRKSENGFVEFSTHEACPISITASAHEIDEELAKGEAGALGQMFVERKTLAMQLAEQRAASEAAKAAATAKAKPAAKAPVKPDPAPAAEPANTEPKPGEPASLW